ncbi:MULTISPECIES: hypothetical protein [Acinetobacter]|uniref:Uncharacterized protein n=1 Tax=Acinetobacter higginsii TaxID=70347 RepID=N8WAQ0_9GAMM|nr:MULTISPECIES: hypothetical protein [Acinetobacter]ENV08991.1 hypothetical protein F966_02636 [Acinetobacter higginsii]NNP67531.1 hypothetical protein [Acinetobacter sp. Ac_5812]
MATNWSAILSNANSLADILMILRKVLASLDTKVDITTIDEAIEEINALKDDVEAQIKHFNEVLEQIRADLDGAIEGLAEAIEIAAAAGAGANGWTDLLIVTEDGRTQRALNRDFIERFKTIPYENQLWQGALTAWQMGHALSVDTTQRKQIPAGITHARAGFADGTTIFHVNGTYEQDAMRIQRNATTTSTAEHTFVINLSFDEAKYLFGNTCCLAWYMFKGSDYQATDINVKILGSDELEQPILRPDGLYSNSNTVIKSEDFNIESRDQDNPFSLVFALPSHFTQIAVLFTIKFINEVAGANDYLEFEGIQLTQTNKYVRTLKLQKYDIMQKALSRYQTTYPYGAPRGVQTEQGAIQMIALNSNINWAFAQNIKFSPVMLMAPQFLFQSPTSGTESRFLDKSADPPININGLAYNLSESGVTITNSVAAVAGHRYLCHWTAQVIF